MQDQTPRFQTKNLDVYDWGEPFETDDIYKQLHALLTPNVTRHLPDSFQFSAQTSAPSDIRAWMAARLAESQILPIIQRQDRSLIGLGILAAFNDQHNSIHIGFLLAEPVWGKGYASEWLRGLIDWQKEQHRPKRLLAGAEKANKASIRVLEKFGFQQADEAADTSNITFYMEI